MTTKIIITKNWLGLDFSAEIERGAAERGFALNIEDIAQGLQFYSDSSFLNKIAISNPKVNGNVLYYNNSELGLTTPGVTKEIYLSIEVTKDSIKHKGTSVLNVVNLGNDDLDDLPSGAK